VSEAVASVVQRPYRDGREGTLGLRSDVAGDLLTVRVRNAGGGLVLRLHRAVQGLAFSHAGVSDAPYPLGSR